MKHMTSASALMAGLFCSSFAHGEVWYFCHSPYQESFEFQGRTATSAISRVKYQANGNACEVAPSAQAARAECEQWANKIGFSNPTTKTYPEGDRGEIKCSTQRTVYTRRSLVEGRHNYTVLTDGIRTTSVRWLAQELSDANPVITADGKEKPQWVFIDGKPYCTALGEQVAFRLWREDKPNLGPHAGSSTYRQRTYAHAEVLDLSTMGATLFRQESQSDRWTQTGPIMHRYGDATGRFANFTSIGLIASYRLPEAPRDQYFRAIAFFTDRFTDQNEYPLPRPEADLFYRGWVADGFAGSLNGETICSGAYNP